MTVRGEVNLSSPPFQLLWSNDTQLSNAVAGTDSLYGVKQSGKVVALSAANGAQRWESVGVYLAEPLALQGSRLFAVKSGEGLTYIDDSGSSANERLAVSFRATNTTNISQLVIDDRRIYLAVNTGLYYVHQDDGLQYGLPLGPVEPYSVGLAATQSILVIDGRGVPARYNVGSKAFEPVWSGAQHGFDTAQGKHPFLVLGTRLIIALDHDIVAYDLSDGSIAWRLPGVPARSLSTDNAMVYAAFHGAAVWAIAPANGAVQWQRQYLYDTSVQGPYRTDIGGGYLYFGGQLRGNPDGAILMALNTDTGSFAWLSRSVSAAWAGGMPIWNGDRLFVYGAARTGAYQALASNPGLSPEGITINPRMLRGAAGDFGSGDLTVTLTTGARVSVGLYRERAGLGRVIANGANWGAGTHQLSWNAGGADGFTDANQFGYVLFDVNEGSGASYSQAILLPVNTFPDIVWHWAGTNIEVMTYYKFVNGYEDATFRPNNLVTRAESSTIIAKSLGLNGPSPGFRTKFTDINTHWAKDFITALEEKGIVGGFAEPDGTFTFRPNLNMTRAQEARILVHAYNIPSAPPGFSTRFTDIRGHWAQPDIEALEAAGYVQGFEEADGSFTYRPEQNLTRAEMCTIIVRIRRLTR